MANGVDTISNVSSAVSCLHNSGYSWVGRYAYATTSSYEIGGSEVSAIHGAGLAIVFLSSTANGNGLNGVTGWTYSNGQTDGQSTAARMSGLGAPAGNGIVAYADVNENGLNVAQCSNLSALVDYLLGFQNGLGSSYVAGVYSNDFTLGYLCTPPSGCTPPSNNISSWPFWDASGVQPSCGAAIIQQNHNISVCTVNVDTDTTTVSSFGQW